MKNKLLFGLTTAITLLSFPHFSSAQAPVLGTTVNFALFTSVGAISNTGISQITGNVASNSGSSTNFGNVNGVMDDNTAASAQAATDLETAYNLLAAAVPTFFPAPLLGNGQVLNAGVYSISGPTVLNLGLTLDAQGNPNATFIFQVQGALSTNASAKVYLKNGALACNVFWKVEGLISMAAGTTMRGTMIANNSAIVIGAGDTLEGRALSTNGAITIDGDMVYTPIGCGSTLLTGPNPPNLVSAACYGVFTSIGPVTNTATSYVSGDVGSNNGLTTGFNPLFVTGAIHSTPDGSTAACAADLLNAYNYLNTLPADIELLFPAQFGSGLVLTPHTYVMNSAVTFTDTLFLNAEGDVNAVFVIQVNAAMTTSTFSVVKLINGAQSKNVFWKIEGAFSLNSNSVFCGTMVSNNGAINIAGGDTIEGRMLSTNGAVNTTSFVLKMPAGCSNAPAIIQQPTIQTVCSGASASFTVIASGTNLTYQWRNGTTVLTNAGVFSGVTTPTLIINPASVTDTSSFYNVIIAGAYAPVDTSAFVVLTVSGVTLITEQPSNQSVCSGNTAKFGVAATGSNLSYQWRNGTVNLSNGGNISGASSDSLIISPATIADTSSRYNVVISGGCGPALTSIHDTLRINAISSVNSVSDQIVCDSTKLASILFSGGAAGTVYSWSNSNTSIGLAASGIDSLHSFTALNIGTTPVTATITITPGMGGCFGGTKSFTITVKPYAGMSAVANQSACNNNTTSPVVFGGGLSGAIFTWTNSNTSIGLAANGSGDIAAFTALNSGTTPVTATVTVTASAGGCSGKSETFLITANPTPVMNPVSDQTVCDNASTAAILFSSNVAGTTYFWSNANTAIGLGTNGNGDISSFIATNTTSGILVAAITVTPQANGCSGVNKNFTISVNPEPVMNAIADQALCSNSSTNATSFNGGANGTVYNWTNSATSIGLAGSGSGDIPSFTALNSGAATVVANINVVPSFGGCNGATVNFSITVNPTPVMSPVANQTVCDSASTSAVVFAGGPAGTTYSWTNNSTQTGLGNNGTGNIPSFTGINTGTNPLTATIIVIPSTLTCTGAGLNFQITVNPTVVAVASSNTPVCVDSPLELAAQTLSGATYSWTGPASFSSTLQNPVIDSALLINSGTYTLTVSNNGCTSAGSETNVLVKTCVITDLSIVKSVNVLSPIFGHNIIFTIKVTNNGPGNATGVAVTDILQDGYVYVSSTTSAGVFNSGTGVWTIGSMNDGETDVLTITATVVSGGDYVNTAIIYGNETDPNMANNTSTVYTLPTEFFIPQGFSPNGDGINDLFVIEGLDMYPNNSITIFNRWGDQVFSENPYSNTWDGTSSGGLRVGGNTLPVGTYFYILNLGDGSAVLKGTIYLNK